MDTQLHSLDEIVSRVRAQNDAHHAAHTSSLSALSSTVQSSYSSIGDHLSTSFARVQSLESDVSEQTAAFKDTLPTLSAEAIIRAPLHELRDVITNSKLVEYNPTGETPQRVAYAIPTQLPRTEAHETFLSRFRDRSNSSDTNRSRSPSKSVVFNDATVSINTASEELIFASKPDIARSVSANTGMPSMPATSSLRELDVNVIAQETMTIHKENTISLESSSDAAPTLKKGKADADSKLPMKKMSRKTVAALGIGADRENLSITNFTSSVGPGGAAPRRLRSHGSQ
jgi:kinesin family protein 11